MQPALEKLYKKAYGICVNSGYLEEIEYTRKIPPFNKMTRESFISQYVWVVLNTGMKEQIARKIYDKFMSSYNFDVIRHQQKREAILKVCADMDKYFIGIVGLEDLEQLPFIGPITKYHLARNLGMDVAKPDRHLVRLAEHHGYTNVQKFCKDIGNIVNERIGVVDVVLWRACNLVGSKLLL